MKADSKVAAALPKQGQRMALTILMTDLCNSTQIAAEMEPEIYADFLRAYRTHFDAIVSQNRGVVARIDGDGALCIFGYPNVDDKSTRNAINAAIGLHKVVSNLAEQFELDITTIKLHSAVNSGVVLLSDGDIVRGRFEVLGDVANVTARLCDHAKPDQIVIPEAALGADRFYYELEPCADLLLSGRKDQFHVVSILGHHAPGFEHRFNARHANLHFIGRDSELSALSTWSQSLDCSGATALVVHGSPGIGKTRLVTTFLANSKERGLQYFWGSCEDQIGAHPLQPFIQILQQINLLEKLALPTGEYSVNPREFAQDFTTNLAAAIGVNTCLLVLEDWHWASDAARQVLSLVLTMLPRNVKLLLISRNYVDSAFAPISQSALEVPTWSPEEIEQAIDAVLGTGSFKEEEWLAESCGGNPLFLEELCYGVQRGEAKREGKSKNAWLETLIQARFSKLPESDAKILQAAAVLGRFFPTWLFECVANTEVESAGVSRLFQADFLSFGEFSGNLRFKHGITRDAIYALINPKLRMSLHAIAADKLKIRANEEGELAHLDALTLHNFASGRIEAALEFSMKAGDLALSTDSLDRARAHFLNSFSLLPKLTNKESANKILWSVVNKFGLACVADPAPDQLDHLYTMTERLRKFGKDDQLARAAYWHGVLNYGLGNGRDSVRYLREALKMAQRSGNQRFVLQINLRLANSLSSIIEYEEAAQIYQSVFSSLAPEQTAIDQQSYLYGVACFTYLCADQGHFDGYLDQIASTNSYLTSKPSAVNASILTQRATMAADRADWSKVVEFSNACLENARSVRTPYQTMSAKSSFAYASWKLTRDLEALDSLARAALWFENGNSMQRVSKYFAFAVDAFEEAGQTSKARSFAARALLRGHRYGDRLGEGMAYRTLARMSAKMGQSAKAQRYIDAAYKSANAKGSGRETALTQFLEAEIAIGQGDMHKAKPLLADCIAAFAAMGLDVFKQQAVGLAKGSP
jgi:class 3 adenylate cyclase/tetratricopeptide (TPR) repeat protein